MGTAEHINFVAQLRWEKKFTFEQFEACFKKHRLIISFESVRGPSEYVKGQEVWGTEVYVSYDPTFIHGDQKFLTTRADSPELAFIRLRSKLLGGEIIKTKFDYNQEADWQLRSGDTNIWLNCIREGFRARDKNFLKQN